VSPVGTHGLAGRLLDGQSEAVWLNVVLLQTARGLVEAQRAFDDLGYASLDRWDEEGIEPFMLTTSRIQVSCPAAFAVEQNGVPPVGCGVRLLIAPRQHAQARVTVGFRYVPTPVESNGD
jgi:hypothetical protein